MANIKSIDQNIMLQNCKQQKEWAQKQLYDTYEAVLFPICLRYAIDYDEAKDIFQEGFIRIFNNIKQFKNEGSLEGWLRRVMVTTAINFIKKYRKVQITNIETINTNSFNSNNVQTHIEQMDVMQAFNSLPYGYKIILNLHVIEGYSYKELSDLLDLEESSCRTKVFRAKQLLQKILNKENSINVIVKK
jgi:RNA polymerase sigma factor (sigma-70 family)